MMFRTDIHKNIKGSFDFHALFTANLLWDFSRQKFLLLTEKSTNLLLVVCKLQASAARTEAPLEKVRTVS